MTIDGLTKEQVMLLDCIWSCESLEEFHEWKSMLSEDQQRTVDVLVEMLMIAEADEKVSEMTHYPDAMKLLENIL